MASAYTLDPMRALVIADERGALWDAQSSYTEAGPRAGVPSPSGVSHMALTASGTQDQSSSLEVQVLRAGVARGSASLSAGYAWRSGSSGDWYGWDAPTVLARVESLEWVDGGTAVTQALHPDAVSLPDGKWVCAYEVIDTGAAASQDYQVRVDVRATDGTITTVEVFKTSFAIPTDQGYYPALLREPSTGRLLLYHWVFDPDLTQANIRVHYSDDDGATWAVGQQYALDTPLLYAADSAGAGSATYFVGRIRAAYSLGQVLLMAVVTSNNSTPTFRNRILQAASLDRGFTLEQVEIWSTDAEGPHGVDILAIPSGFLIAYAAGDAPSGADADAPLTVMTLGSAYESSESATHTAVSAAFTNSVGTVSNANGKTTGSGVLLTRLGETVWLHAITDDTASSDHYSATWYSADYGATWSVMYSDSTEGAAAHWWEGATADKRPAYLAGAWAEGTLLLAASSFSGTSSEDALWLYYLGGYSTVTMPGWARWLSPDNRCGWSHTYAPFATPDVIGWTGAGSGTGAVDDGRLEILTSAGQTRTYTHTPTASVATGYVVAFSMQQVSGGGVGSQAISLAMRLDDGTEGYEIVVRIGSGSYSIYDTVAAASIGTGTLDFATTGGDLLIGFAGGSVAAWHRERAASTLRAWTAGPTSTTLSDSGTTGPGANRIQWGHRVAGAAETRWYSVCYSEGGETGSGLHGGFTNPDDLHPAPVSAIYGTQLAQGVTIRAEAGPAVRGDTWTVATRHDYPVERILPAAAQLSPRWGWRSTSTAAQQIAVQLSSQGDTSQGSDLIAVCGYGCNVPRVQLHGYDLGTTSWVLIGTVDLYEDLSGLRWTREGSSVTASTAGSSGNNPYLYHEEFAGAIFAFSDTVSRRISHHTEGKWTDSTTRRPVLMLEGVDGTEGTTGTGGYIIPSDWVIVVDLAGTVYSGIRVTIPTPTTSVPAPPEAYWEIGTLVVGPVVVHPLETSWGRTLDVEHGTEVREGRDRTRRAYTYAPARRVIEYSWQDARDTANATNPDGDPDPDYLLGSATSGALAVAADDDLWSVEGLVRRLGGPGQPVVYLPRLAKFSDSEAPRVYNRRHEHMLGRITSDVPIESVQGDELEDEVVRVGPIRIEEEV